MFTIFGRSQQFCDGVSRRGFLKIGALGVGGLTLANLLRAEALAGSVGERPSRKSIINIYLPGGPSHQDMFDLKPQAPLEFRGEFHPIATTVPGMEICQHFPRLAERGEKFAVVRSITGVRDEHSQNQSDSGWSESSLRTIGGRPGIGAVLSKVHGPSNGNAPTFVSLTGFGEPGFLGSIHGPYRPDGPGRENLRLQRSITVDRLNDRKKLLEGLDALRRDVDAKGMMDAMDSFNQRAVDVITSAELANALDLSKEDPRQVEAYGTKKYDENRRFLMARRLLEVGVRFVGLSWGGWDTHGDNFNQLRRQLPPLDAALAALIDDLDSRGMLEDTILMMSGEFGRTPRVNSGMGRDHWPRATFFFLAGGGLKTGQVIGSTNRLAEEPKDRPVHLQQVFATVYRQLGVDVGATLIDPNGRPQYLLDHREPIGELL
ncbi:MAG: DUF1501 domain-containing protein [Planctomycetia bacterium]|nr:DUF1501 domain-containing protein [Planctomycetia bacterium]